MTSQPKVSVIIATYNREQVLCDTIRMVLSEPYANKEVVVVDQTAVMSRPLRDYSRVGEVVHPLFPPRAPERDRGREHRHPRSHRRDSALHRRRDVSFKPGLIAAHVRNYVDPRVTGVGGLVLEIGHSETTRLSSRCSDPRVGYFFFRHDYAGRVWVANVAEGNMSFRRQALLDVGLIDERFRENAYLWGMDPCPPGVGRRGPHPSRPGGGAASPEIS